MNNNNKTGYAIRGDAKYLHTIAQKHVLFSSIPVSSRYFKEGTYFGIFLGGVRYLHTIIQKHVLSVQFGSQGLLYFAKGNLFWTYVLVHL